MICSGKPTVKRQRKLNIVPSGTRDHVPGPERAIQAPVETAVTAEKQFKSPEMAGVCE